MKICIDDNLSKLLPAYELGMLGAEDEQRFETHLLMCDSCLEKVRKGQQVFQIIRSDVDFRETANQFARASEGNSTIPFYGRFRWTIAPSFILAMVILIVIILSPWNVRIDFDKTAYAENRLAILYFDDVSDPADTNHIAEMATNLLITDLSQSKYLRVVSGQYLQDILKLIKHNDSDTTQKDLAPQIAEIAKAKWLLKGNILKSDSSYILSSQLLDVASGEIINSQKIEGQVGENIFRLIDKLSLRIRSDIPNLDDKAIVEDRMIADVTTSSTQAYRQYIEGLDYYSQHYPAEAATSFNEALRYDSTFTMVYYYLSKIYGPPRNTQMINLAEKYINKVSDHERYLIRIQKASLTGDMTLVMTELLKLIELYPLEKYPFYLLADYFYQQRKYEEAIYYLNKVIELDPLYKEAYNLLAYSYSNTNSLNKAIEALDKYDDIAPDEANPFDSRAEIYAKFGKIEKAIETYERALEIKPDFYSSLYYLGNLYLYLGDDVKAQEYYDRYIATNPKAELLSAKLYRAYILLHQGKIEESITRLNEGITIAQLAVGEGWESGQGGVMQWLKFRVLSEMKNSADVMTEIVKTKEIAANCKTPHYYDMKVNYCELLAATGDYHGAETIAESLKEPLQVYYQCLGYIEFARKNYKLAAYYYEKSRGNTLCPIFYYDYMLARSYFEAEEYQKAINEFNRLLSDYKIWTPNWSVWFVMTHYYLGLSYEKVGNYEMAAENYGRFLEIWRNADTNIKEIDLVKERLKRLKINQS